VSAPRLVPVVVQGVASRAVRETPRATDAGAAAAIADTRASPAPPLSPAATPLPERPGQAAATRGVLTQEP
jgi:hypothetical protein